ncbi:MAG: hypothetical protein IJ174_09745, partial [Clostridia bacterium]|nr:hypothetical protein [Clostridia bacterium]
MESKMIKWGFCSLLAVYLLVFCLLGFAAAESPCDLSHDGYDLLEYDCTLPDGRLILTGQAGKIGNYQESRARILCLNADRSVAWEYLDPAKGNCMYHEATLLSDGTIGVVFQNAPYQELIERKLKFFTTDGTPTGKEIDIPLDRVTLITGVTEHYLEISCFEEDSPQIFYGLMDWSGQILFSMSRGGLISGSHTTFEEEDGMVLIGSESGPSPTNAKIMKIDLTGCVLWETVLPSLLPESNHALLDWAIKTDDGGYAAFYRENRPFTDKGETEWACALVKFSPTGRLLWMNRESFGHADPLFCDRLTAYQDMYVIEVRETGVTDYSCARPREFIWFDQDGNEIGRTSLTITKDALPRLSNASKIMNYGGWFVPMEDGLWTLRD